MAESVENRILRYWTARACSFGKVRKDELHNMLGIRWYEELKNNLPEKNGTRILDVGTGTGYFSILLARHGYDMVGIDLTPAMIDEARAQADEESLKILFYVMDGQKLSFPDESFDAVITRNLTWTLPNPEKAYHEWYRVLKKGGILLNYDANYGSAVKNSKSGDNIGVYGHAGVTPDMERENAAITLSMEINGRNRPDWDLKTLKETGFTEVFSDIHAGERILLNNSDPKAPVFMIRATK
jgi:SAM-dependent methyltransferase